MFVKADPRAEKIRKSLPGANCGACGFSGCDAYAHALIDGETATNLCPPGGDEALTQINEILGISAGEGLKKMTAIVHCLGDTKTMRNKMEYIGINSCFAAKQLFGGQGACTYGCAGFGDCVKVCPSAGIYIADNLARVDTCKCSGCAVCVKACPMGVISVETVPRHTTVLCNNTEKGAKLKDKCSKGCIGCSRCVKECPVGAIKVEDNLAIIDNAICEDCKRCLEVCVKKCISFPLNLS